MKKHTPEILVAAILVLFAVFAWFWSHRFTSTVSAKMLPVTLSTPNEAIRQHLISLTPIGLNATNVLLFAVNDLHPTFGATAHFTYVDALRDRVPRRGYVVPTDVTGGPNPMPRSIEVTLARYYERRHLHLLTARWIFDQNDTLVDITVSRYGVYP